MRFQSELTTLEPQNFLVTKTVWTGNALGTSKFGAISKAQKA